MTSSQSDPRPGQDDTIGGDARDNHLDPAPRKRKTPLCQVDYLVATGGSGSTRMYLEELPNWIDAKTGALVFKVRVL